MNPSAMALPVDISIRTASTLALWMLPGSARLIKSTKTYSV
jgi:hypothetical protein